MKIKSLELFGFKSFVDRTLFEFPTGITAIVGPNGCGKSNIVDAIRWTMGEMSAKHLRGRSMEDVIFMGSESRPAVNMAEVTLTFSNEDGLAPPQYADMPELSITRRVFREMESEYLINKIPCRLRDVHELFMDTGIGTRAYAIVEQGHIAGLVSARPADRRALIEEAAGITKYKAKKEAAIRKMEAANQNLLRVGDVVHEVRRQMTSLDRQARKAERYKALREELRALDLDTAFRQARALEREVREKAEALAGLRREIEALSSAIATEESAAETLRLELTERERALQTRQEQLHELRGTVAQHESQRDLQAKDRENLEAQRGRWLEEIESLRAEVRNLEEASLRVQAERDAAVEEETGRQRAQAAAEERLADLIRQEASLAEEIGRANTALLTVSAEFARVEKSAEDLAQRRAEAISRAESVSRTLGESRARLEALEGAVTEATRRLGEAREEGERVRQQREDALGEVESLARQESEAEFAWHAARDRMRESGSRLDSLRELESRFEGYKEGVRAILMARENEPDRRQRVIGLLAEMIDAPAEIERAVEAALGDRLQYVVVEDVDAGIEAVEYLKRSSAGRSSFVPLGLRETRHSGGPKPDAVLAPALLDMIRVEERYRPVVSSLLRDVHVVDTLARAAAIWRANGFRGTLVTKEGDVIDRLGVMTGGSAAAAGGGIFARKREIRELSDRVCTLQAEVARAEAAFGERTAARDAARAKAESLAARLHEKDLERVAREQALERIAAEGATLARAIEGLEEEWLTVSEAAASATAILEEATLRRASLADARRRGEEGLGRFRDARVSVLADLETARLVTMEIRVAAAGLAERARGLEQESLRLGEAERERAQRIARATAAAADALRRIEEIGESLREAEQVLALLISQHGEGIDMLAKLRDAFQLDADRLNGADHRVRDLHHQQQAIGEQVSKLQVSETEVRLRLQHLADGVFDRHNVRLEDLPIDEEASVDLEERERRQADLRTQIERLGEVSVTAIEEYQELSERYRFLTEQSEDLRAAIESLQNAIQKINRTSRKLFVETFEKVAAKFEETFPRLFKGGRAKLVLAEAEDVLESGVEIIAQPLGKRLQNVSLLSGGEQTLTAVSLLFAIFQVKPSPFFLLDEVDAALDDANVERFNALLRAMTERSQFLTITHNKATIELADTLYGITMEDPGVSKVVSVKLR